MNTNETWAASNGIITNRLADGTALVTTTGPEFRFGMMAAFVRTQSVRAPSGLTSTTVNEPFAPFLSSVR